MLALKSILLLVNFDNVGGGEGSPTSWRPVILASTSTENCGDDIRTTVFGRIWFLRRLWGVFWGMEERESLMSL